jgi:hypothetical protein
MHTSTNKSHKDQLQTTEQPTWAHTHTWTLEASKTQVAISDTATAQITTLKNLGNTRITYKPRHTHTHTHTHTPKPYKPEET